VRSTGPEQKSSRSPSTLSDTPCRRLIRFGGTPSAFLQIYQPHTPSRFCNRTGAQRTPGRKPCSLYVDQAILL
jgi:hypothetical protein